MCEFPWSKMVEAMQFMLIILIGQRHGVRNIIPISMGTYMMVQAEYMGLN